MAIYEIILCVVILLASVLVCAVTLSMDKADKNALGVCKWYCTAAKLPSFQSEKSEQIQ